jgi:hypothetical protein
MTFDLGRIAREEMDMNIARGRPEHAVFVEFRLPHAQLIAGGHHELKVGFFIRGVRDDDQDVDDRFGRQAGDGCRSDVFDSLGHVA